MQPINDYFPLISFIGSLLMVAVGYGSLQARLKEVERKCDKFEEVGRDLAKLDGKIDTLLNRFTYKNQNNV